MDNKPTCCGNVVENTVLNKTFFVCQKCKKEVITQFNLGYEFNDANVAYAEGYPIPTVEYSYEPNSQKAENEEEQLELFDWMWY